MQTKAVTNTSVARLLSTAVFVADPRSFRVVAPGRRRCGCGPLWLAPLLTDSNIFEAPIHSLEASRLAKSILDTILRSLFWSNERSNISNRHGTW